MGGEDELIAGTAEVIDALAHFCHVTVILPDVVGSQIFIDFNKVSLEGSFAPGSADATLAVSN